MSSRQPNDATNSDALAPSNDGAGRDSANTERDHVDHPIDLSIIVPVFRSCQTIDALVHEIHETLEFSGIRYEVVLVDDASGRKTWNKLCELGEHFPGLIHAVRLRHNVGQHHATLCGLREARGSFVATMDDDLQHPPEEIWKLLAVLKTGYFDVVYARYRRKQSWLRNLFGVPLLWWAKWAFRVPAVFSSFRLIRRDVVDKIVVPKTCRVLVDQLIFRVTRRVTDIAVAHRARSADDSSYSIRKLVKLALVVIASAPRERRLISFAVLSAALSGGFVLGTWAGFGSTGMQAVFGYGLAIASLLGLVGAAGIAWGTRRLLSTDELDYQIEETCSYRKTEEIASETLRSDESTQLSPSPHRR